jgi:hypothetical protein
MSLIYGDNFNGQLEFPSENMESNWYYAFFSLFYNQDKLISAENLILPATILPARCYSSMFYGCTSLITAPELPALTLSSGCYESMFSGCTSLNSIRCLATNIAADGCTSYWLEDVAANGTFIKNEKMASWPTGMHGIPSGWTIKNI